MKVTKFPQNGVPSITPAQDTMNRHRRTGAMWERERCAKIVRDRMVDDNRNSRNDLLEQIASDIESP